jgi:MFS family permease
LVIASSKLQQIAQRRAAVPVLGDVQFARRLAQPRRHQHGRRLRPGDAFLPDGNGSERYWLADIGAADAAERACGLKGWQWMFLIEALPALLLTPVILKVLSDKPSDASWLSVPERDWLIERLDKEACQTRAADQHGLLKSFLSPVVIWLGVAYFGTTGINHGLFFFLPQIVEQFGLRIVQTGFVSAIPFAVAMVGMIWWGRRSDRLAERRFHLLLPLALAATRIVEHLRLRC